MKIPRRSKPSTTYFFHDACPTKPHFISKINFKIYFLKVWIFVNFQRNWEIKAKRKQRVKYLRLTFNPIRSMGEPNASVNHRKLTKRFPLLLSYKTTNFLVEEFWSHKLVTMGHCYINRILNCLQVRVVAARNIKSALGTTISFTTSQCQSWEYGYVRF